MTNSLMFYQYVLVIKKQPASLPVMLTINNLGNDLWDVEKHTFLPIHVLYYDGRYAIYPIRCR